MSDLKEKIMRGITNDEIKARPKSFFIFMRVLTEIGLVALSLLVIFLVNLSFYLPKKGLGLGLGVNRWSRIMSVVPWEIVLLGIVGFAILVWVLYRSTELYKQYFVWIVGLFLVAIIAAGFLLSVSSFNQTFDKGMGLYQYQVHSPGSGWVGQGFHGGRNAN